MTDGSMRATRPATTPLRVSTSAFWPSWMSLACVSAILISAFSAAGWRRAPDSCPARPVGRLRPAPAAASLSRPARTFSSSFCCCVRREGPRLVDSRLLHGELRAHRLGLAGQLILGDLVAHAELVGVHLRLPQLQRRHELIVGERLVHLSLHPRLVVVGLDLRGGCARLRAGRCCSCTFRLASPASAAASFSSASCSCCSRVRVRQLENDVVRLHRGARPQNDLFHASLRRRRNPADIFWRERAEAANLHEPSSPRLTVSGQTTARSTVGAAGFSRERPKLTGRRRATDGGVNDLTNPLLLGIGRASNIHGCFELLDGNHNENDREDFPGANGRPQPLTV